MNEKILCVDDEPSILEGFQRHLRRRFVLVTRSRGEEALGAIQAEGPFSVIVSDMQMPGMDGVRFLAKARELAPDSVRIMLTGMSDLQTAVNAVNEGNIFRFLTKPCPPDVLLKALEAGSSQYRLIMAERELLENTLKGSIKVLVDMLSLSNPAAFSRAMRIKHCVGQVVSALKLPDAWSYDVAAMLSQIGCVTIPPDTLEHLLAGKALSECEQRMVREHPGVGRNLIANIPRLEGVAEMIARQGWTHVDLRAIPSHETDPVCMGAAILRAVMDYEALLFSGQSSERALESMGRAAGTYDPRVLRLLNSIELPACAHGVRILRIMELQTGLVLAEEVRTRSGVLVVSKGQEVTDTLRRRLENFLSQGSIEDSVRVISQ